ncbi:hypothetical protein [Priestia megaterium]|uniref:hypothetical protein n=1 Tax=Priestia megaterium TaxID=1404 RepID=UPI002079A832|nr:hypothetical protein [Priestia megaterium]USL45834.1 hypothetical protein LIS78_31075 [Priestia megaterium]
MKKFSFPTVVEFGNASNLIQGCGGWGTENLTLDDSDSRYKWIYTTRWVCICTSLKGNGCTPIS